MADRNRELVPDNCSLVRKRTMTIGLCSEGWYSEHSGVYRRAELPGGSVKVDLDHVTHTCPTGLRDLPVQS